ncbi:ATP-dependent DNA helicase RecG [bacterium]|nr:ATP-dependent DNA helicase RecG [bacterium]
MASRLNDPVNSLRMIGEHRQRTLADAGILNLGQLLEFYPRRYLDRSRIQKIGDLLISEYESTVVGEVVFAREQRIRGGRTILIASIDDGSAALRCVWFQGVAYWKMQLVEGETVAVSGKLSEKGGREFIHPAIDRLGEDGDRELFNTGRIIALYPGSMEFRKVGLNSANLRKIMREALNAVGSEFDEYLPEEDLQRVRASNRCDSIHQIHFPDSNEDLAAAWRRVRYDELFFLQLLFAVRRHLNRSVQAKTSFETIGPITRKVLDALPFELTDGQKRVLSEIRTDLESSFPMQRLLHGEVGTGKTTVALLAAAMAADSGFQTVFMAPTELLSEQHAQTLLNPAEAGDLQLRLLRGKQKTAERREILNSVASGRCDILVGTHSVLNEQVQFAKLGLVIIDEQHRFGVEQRAALSAKGAYPNLLVMSATPIPRTMRLAGLGDLDVSELKELPGGKRQVQTAVRRGVDRAKIYEFVRQEAQRGNRIFIVCPLVEESEKLDIEAATEYYKRVTCGELREVGVGLLHGRQSSEERNAALTAFRDGSTPVLVATTVVEVGVDVPDSGVMIVENPERFGLAALHQLRGRIGRKGQKAWFILLPGSKLTPQAEERLKVIAETDDGFEIAEHDLRIRGAGEFFGTRQSGEFELRYADPVRDEDMLLWARERALSIVDNDPDLNSYPSLKTRFHEKHAPKLGLLAGG